MPGRNNGFSRVTSSLNSSKWTAMPSSSSAMRSSSWQATLSFFLRGLRGGRGAIGSAWSFMADLRHVGEVEAGDPRPDAARLSAGGLPALDRVMRGVEVDMVEIVIGEHD